MHVKRLVSKQFVQDKEGMKSSLLARSAVFRYCRRWPKRSFEAGMPGRRLGIALFSGALEYIGLKDFVKN
jgi:hypothetical protein